MHCQLVFFFFAVRIPGRRLHFQYSILRFLVPSAAKPGSMARERFYRNLPLHPHCSAQKECNERMAWDTSGSSLQGSPFPPGVTGASRKNWRSPRSRRPCDWRSRGGRPCDWRSRSPLPHLSVCPLPHLAIFPSSLFSFTLAFSLFPLPSFFPFPFPTSLWPSLP